MSNAVPIITKCKQTDLFDLKRNIYLFGQLRLFLILEVYYPILSKTTPCTTEILTRCCTILHSFDQTVTTYVRYPSDLY